MRHIARLIVLSALVVSVGAGTAGATTIEDLLKFKAGPTPLSDDLLIALIESDGSIFHLSGEDVLALKKKGFSDKLLIAMLKTTAKERPVRIDPPVVDPAEPVSEGVPGVPVPVMKPAAPVVVNVNQKVEQRVEMPRQDRGYDRTVYVPIAVPVVRQPPPKPAPPVYWGWGGQPRPDSWKTPDKPEVKPDPKKPGGGL